MKALLFAVIALYAGGSLGRRALDLLRIRHGSGAESLVYSTGAGLWLLSLIIFVSGISGFGRPMHICAVVLATVAACALLDLLSLMKKRNGAKPAETGSPLSKKGVPIWAYGLLALIGVSLAINIFRSFLPVFDFDSLSYHLAVPKLYLLQGRITYLPTNFYSNFPQTAEMLYMAALAFGTPAAAPLIHTAFGALTALNVYAWLARKAGAPAAMAGAAIFFLTPIVALESPTAMIDLAVAFYASACVFALADTGEDQQFDGPALAALFGGIAISAKWSCVTVVALALIWWLVSSFRGGRKELRPARLLAIALLAAAPSLPYLIKNLVFTGNPVWPMLFGVFGGRDMNAEAARTIVESIRLHGGEGHTFKDLLLLPWSVTMREWRFQGAISPVLLCIVPLYAFVRRNKSVSILLVFGLIWIPVWFFTLNLSLRMFLPALPLLAAVAGYSVVSIPQKWLRVFCGAFIAAHLCYALGSSIAGASGIKGELRYIVARDDAPFLKMVLPEYKLYEWVNAHARPGDVTMLGEVNVRGYYIDTPYVWAHPVMQGRYGFDKMRSGDELHGLLKKDGVKYVVFRYDPFVVFSNNHDLPFMGRQGTAVWRDFLSSRTKVVFEDRVTSGVVFELKP